MLARPSQVIAAIRIMWGLLIVAALLVLLPIALLILSAGIALLDLIPLVAIIVCFGLMALLVRAVSHGRNWARYLYGAVAVLSILTIGASIIRVPEVGLYYGLVRVAVALIYGLVLYLLFHPASGQWFTHPSERAP